MIKKESSYKILDSLLSEFIKELMKLQKFSYNKNYHTFQRKIGNFKQLVIFSKQFTKILFDKNSDTLYLQSLVKAKIEIPSFQKWYKSNYTQPGNLNHVVYRKRLLHKIDFKEYNSIEVYKPSKSQIFKNFVSNGINNQGGISNLEIVNLEFLKTEELNTIIQLLNDELNFDRIFSNRRHNLDIKYIRLLVFLEKTETAQIYYEKLINQYANKIQLETDERMINIYKREHNKIIDDMNNIFKDKYKKIN